MDWAMFNPLVFLVGVTVGMLLLQRFVAPVLPREEQDYDSPVAGFWMLSFAMSFGINLLLVMQCGWYLW